MDVAAGAVEKQATLQFMFWGNADGWFHIIYDRF